MHNWDPEDYEKSSSAQYSWAVGLISRLKLRGDELILDIGCGDGRVTAHLAALVPRGAVVGIDLSPDMIAFARETHSTRAYPNLFFQVGDASSLRFGDEFDLVVSFACLHWVKDHLSVLQGIHRSLRPGGRVLLQCGGKGNAARILEITGDLIQEARWSEYFHDFAFPYNFYEPMEYDPWLVSAGLVPRRVELVPKDMVHAGKAGLEGIIRNTWLPYLERLPDELRPQFVSEVARIYIERYPLDERGMVHVPMMRLEVEAEKPL